MNLALYRPSFPTSAVDRLFETVFNGHPFNARESISPRVDVYNEEKKLVLEVELPGVLKPDIAVSVEDGHPDRGVSLDGPGDGGNTRYRGAT